MMRRLSFPTIAIALLSSLEAGCFGGVVMYMTECKSSLPICDYKYSKEDWGPTENAKIKNPPKIPNTLPPKDEFLAEWGVPSEIITVSEDEVTLIYKTVDIWCGVIPAWGVAVPLIAPTCEGFDRITFKGNKAIYIHFKRRNVAGIAAAVSAVGASMGESCPIPCREVAPFVWTDSPER
ncbi:MAG: hypothetical protein KA535_09765 [Azonexus sp.]|nr:hypothetical protein [Azonexus sp.]